MGKMLLIPNKHVSRQASYGNRQALPPQKFASWLSVMTFTLPDWYDNIPIHLYMCNYAPVLPVNVSGCYFLTRPHEKVGVWGRD